MPHATYDPSGGSASLQGAFYTLLVAADGHTYLQGGTVTGSTGTETAANIKVIDSGTGPTQSAGVHMWAAVTVAAIEADGIMMSGVNVTAASIGYGSTVPDDVMPTLTTSGTKHVSLGQFTATGFLPSALGNVQISFCPPNTLSASRDG
jgi:hypothetical protein